jgi:hypothetical protein
MIRVDCPVADYRHIQQWVASGFSLKRQAVVQRGFRADDSLPAQCGCWWRCPRTTGTAEVLSFVRISSNGGLQPGTARDKRLTQRRNFTTDGTAAALLQCAWQSARSWITTKLKGFENRHAAFHELCIQHYEVLKGPLRRFSTKLHFAERFL